MAGLAAYTKHMGAGVGRMSNVIIERGAGSWLYSVSGEKYLDMTSGIGVTSTGHCHPKVVQAANAQATKIIHAQVEK
jgi:4-aminobutyrate aminotransferase